VAEQLLGDALRERTTRENVIIATKGGLRMDGDRLLRDASRRWLREGVESSLRNLRTDYIDIYQVHWPDRHTPPEETAAALEELVGEGRSATSACPTLPSATAPARSVSVMMAIGRRLASSVVTTSALSCACRIRYVAAATWACRSTVATVGRIASRTVGC
jgi:aryl-alcohol dehydrogenase-like predicted oxidoreductase